MPSVERYHAVSGVSVVLVPVLGGYGGKVAAELVPFTAEYAAGVGLRCC